MQVRIVLHSTSVKVGHSVLPHVIAPWTIPVLYKTLVLELARCEYLVRKENVLLFGNIGKVVDMARGLPSRQVRGSSGAPIEFDPSRSARKGRWRKLLRQSDLLNRRGAFWRGDGRERQAQEFPFPSKPACSVPALGSD